MKIVVDPLDRPKVYISEATKGSDTSYVSIVCEPAQAAIIASALEGYLNLTYGEVTDFMKAFTNSGKALKIAANIEEKIHVWFGVRISKDNVSHEQMVCCAASM